MSRIYKLKRHNQTSFLRRILIMGSRQVPVGKVLLTGGNGFIASHILDHLLDRGYTVVATVRSEAKGYQLIESYEGTMQEDNVSFVVVKDIVKEGAFDKAVKADPPFDYVVHTASPYFLNPQDPEKDFLNPAIKGTQGILRSVQRYAPSVKRVVFTSSSAAVLDPDGPDHHQTTYDETFWAPMTWEKALEPKNAYRASKVYAEKFAWSFIDEKEPPFDLAVINNTYTFGPIPRHLPNLDALNTSNHRIRDMVLGRMRDQLQPTGPVFTFVDVRDVAVAHVRAMELPKAGGNRFYLVADHFSNKRLVDIIRETHPGLADRLPVEDYTFDDIPENVYGFNNAKSKEALGVKYRSLKQSVADTVDSILEFQEQFDLMDGLEFSPGE